jgi:hypothetical protein
MHVSEAGAVSEVLCLVSDGHYSESSNCSISDEEKGRRAVSTCVTHLIKWRHALWRCISPLLHMQKKSTHRLFSTGFSLHQHAARPLAHIRARMCANCHSAVPSQEALRGAQVV